MPASSEWERWRARACANYDDTYGTTWHTDHDDKGRTRVARRGDGPKFDSGCNIRSGTIYNNNGNRQQQQDAAELLQAALLEIERQRLKPKAPPLKAATPEACGEFLRQWGEFSEAGTAVEAGNSVRSCIPDQRYAIVCLLSDFPTHHVPSIRDDERLECLRCVVQPHRCTSAIAMYDRLQLAAKSVASPHNANEVHRHVLSTWEAMSAAISDSNYWPLFKNAGNMWGAWKPAAGKSFSKVFIEALRPHQFRETYVTN